MKIFTNRINLCIVPTARTNNTNFFLPGFCSAGARKSLLIRNTGMYPLYIVADIQHYTCKEVKYEWETHRQK